MSGTEQELELWWVSLVDPALSAPEGEQVPGGGGFLGVVIVSAVDANGAVDRAADVVGAATGTVRHAHASVIGPFPAGSLSAEYRDRLLTQDEAGRVPEPVDWPEMETPPVVGLSYNVEGTS